MWANQLGAKWRRVYFGARVGVACFRVHADDTVLLMSSLLMIAFVPCT